MKKTFISALFAIFILVLAAHAQQVSVGQNSLSFVSTSVSPDGAFTNRNTEISDISTNANEFTINNLDSNGSVTMDVLNTVTLNFQGGNSNSGVSTQLNLSVSDSSGNVPFIIDSNNGNYSQFTLGNGNATTNANSTTLELIPINQDNVEAGMYSGTVQLINVVNGIRGQVIESMPVQVLVPALQINKVEVQNGYGDTTSTLKKGDNFTITITYKDIAQSTDLTNLDVKVGIYQDSGFGNLAKDADGNQLQDDQSANDLSSGGTDSQSFSFNMPYNVNDGTQYYILAEVTASSQDTSASFYTKDTDKTIKASVPDDAIQITRASANPSYLSCGTNITRFSIEVQNVGRNEESLSFYVRNAATGFEQVLNGANTLRLNNNFNNDDYTQDYSEEVTLTDLKPGINTYTMYAYYGSGDNEYTSQDVPITSGCAAAPVQQPVTQPQQNVTPVVVIQQQPVTQPVTTNPVTTTPTTPYVTLKDVSGSSDWVLPVVIGVCGLIIGVIVAMLLIPRP